METRTLLDKTVQSRGWLARSRALRQDESGAVTVDWVVLTATIIGIGLLVLVPVAFSANSTVQGVAAYIADLPMVYNDK